MAMDLERVAITTTTLCEKSLKLQTQQNHLRVEVSDLFDVR